MISRNIAALVLGAAMIGVPAFDLVAVAPAMAQSSRTTVQIQSAIVIAVRNARAASGFAGSTPAQRALLLVAAVQAAVAQELQSGASSNDVSAALAALVNAGFISVSVAAQGAAQAATQVASEAGASADAKNQALQLVTSLSNGTGPLGLQVAQAGGLQAVISSLGPGGRPFTTFTNFGLGITGQNGHNPAGYTPCHNVIADYC